MSESDKKILDPLNQDNWNEFGKQFASLFDKAVVDLSKDVATENKSDISEVTERNERIRRKEKISQAEADLRFFLDSFLDKVFSESKIKAGDITKVKAYFRNTILKRLKDEKIDMTNPEINNNVLGILEELAKKRSVGQKNNNPAKIIVDYFKKGEQKEEKGEYREILTKDEKEQIKIFFDKNILSLYEAKRKENNWTGYTDIVDDFLKNQFAETAKTFNFLDGDENKIGEAWKLISLSLAQKIEDIEREISQKEATTQDVKLEKEYIDFADKFLEKGVSFCYQEKREEKGWTGYSDEVLAFIKLQFEELAKKTLKADEDKIEKAWELIAGNVAEKIEIIEKEFQSNKTEKEKTDWTLEEIYKRLKSVGAQDEDINYFFGLQKKDRLDFLNSDDDELIFRIEKLKEQRLSVEKKTKENEEQDKKDYEKALLEKKEEEKRLDKERTLKYFSKEVEKSRNEYVEAESKNRIKLSRLKNFFKNFVSVDKNYEIEKELESYRSAYDNSLKNYMEAIVDLEGISDAEEREIMYRYAKEGEKLKLMDAKEEIKFQKNPRWEDLKRNLEFGTASFLDKYKELINKPKELIMKKTGSKVLGLGSGMVVVGGAMALASSFVPGLRGTTRALSIAVATRGFYKRAEGADLIQKTENLKENIAKVEDKINYINNLGVNTDELFKKEIGLALENIPKEVIREREEVGRRFIKSLGKAVATTSVFAAIGELGKSYMDLNNTEISGAKEDLSNIPETSTPEEGLSQKPDSIYGGAIHNQTAYPSFESQSETAPKNIFETLKELGIEGKVVQNLETENLEVSSELESPEKEIASEVETARPVLDNISIREVSPEDLGASKTGIVNLNIQTGSLKDNLKEYLINHHDKLTVGKMGWEQGTDVEEWADRRAVGIIGELKAQYADYDFNKISKGSNLLVDVNNPSDIKIVGFIDPYDSDVKVEEIIEEEKNKGINHQEDENIKSENREGLDVTKREIGLAHKVGLTPEEYSEINNISIRDFFSLKDSANSNSANVQLKSIFKYLIDNNKVQNLDISVSEAIREIDEKTMNNIFDSQNDIFTSDFKPQENLNYEDSMLTFIREELFEAMRDKSEVGNVFREINKIKDNIASGAANPEIFSHFREAVRNSIGEIEIKETDTVAKYVLKTLKKAYELGQMDELRLALKEIKI